MTTISPRREKTRQRLMSAAVGVIAERGFLAASVEEICDRAGFTRGAFYSNFDTKEDLALALIRANAESQLSNAQVAIAEATQRPVEADTVEGLIDRAVGAFVAAQPTERDPVLLQAELRLHAIRNPEFGAAYASFEDEMTQLFSMTIAGALRGMGLELAVTPEQAVDLLHSVHESACLDRLLRSGGAPGSGDNLKRMVLALVRPV